MKLKSATRFTILTTLLFTTVNIIFYAFLISYMRDRIGDAFDEYVAILITGMMILAFGTALISYFISSLVVDRILNPVRTMINQVKEVGERQFTTRLIIDSEEDELIEYAAAFNEMVFKVNEYIKKQKQFVSDASHELATPLTIINGNADMLLRWGKDNPEQLADSLAIIKNEALRMNELVENLLFFARSDSNRQEYTFELANVNKLIFEYLEEARGLHPDVTFEYNDNPLPERRIDIEAIRRVMRILVENAVKYGIIEKDGAENRRITISINEIENKRIRISVADNGPGIPPASLPYLFDRFYRVDDSRAKKSGGSGLGLAIAKEIIERHGGQIWAENRIGAMFVFEI